jgi:outer membrane protein, multidrug efflux system
MMKRLSLLPLLLACACTTVGPDYAAPTPPASAAWYGAVDTGAVGPAWWSAFGDAELTALVERAIASAPSLAEAEARLAEARANRAITTGAGLPQVIASGRASENRISENGQFPAARIPGFPTEYTLFDAGFDASWEPDFWGRQARLEEASAAQEGAAEAARDAALVALTAEIGRSYIELRAAQSALAAAEQASGAREQLAELARLLAEAGEGNALEAERAAADALAERARIPPLQARAAAAAFRIAALTGEPPEDFASLLNQPAPIPAPPPRIMAGIRSDLLTRRPDVRSAERQLAAATAGIGVATADLFPRFSLSAGLGVQSRSLDGLPDPGAIRLGIGPSFSWPVFSGGRIRAQIAAADARADAAAARYAGAVAEALADSETAINRLAQARAAEELAAAALTRQQRAFAHAEARLGAGEDSRLDLASARLQLIARSAALSEARAASAQAAVALYKALGGAWLASAPGEP